MKPLPISLDWHTDPTFREESYTLQEKLTPPAAQWFQSEHHRLSSILKKTGHGTSQSMSRAGTPLRAQGQSIFMLLVLGVGKSGKYDFSVHVGAADWIERRREKIGGHWENIASRAGVNGIMAEEATL